MTEDLNFYFSKFKIEYVTKLIYVLIPHSNRKIYSVIHKKQFITDLFKQTFRIYILSKPRMHYFINISTTLWQNIVVTSQFT